MCLLFRTDPETGDLYVVARGVARCSRSDQFNKTTGRNIARGRALSACHYKCDRYGGAIGGAITAVFQPLLGEFEQRIMVSVDKQFRSISDGTDTDRLRGW